jgi:hypothetical protein
MGVLGRQCRWVSFYALACTDAGDLVALVSCLRVVGFVSWGNGWGNGRALSRL